MPYRCCGGLQLGDFEPLGEHFRKPKQQRVVRPREGAPVVIRSASGNSLREQCRTLVATEQAYLGTRFALHTCMSQGCVTGWLQTTNSPSQFSQLTMMWRSRSWRKTRNNFYQCPGILHLFSTAPGLHPPYPKDQMPTSRRHRCRQCETVVCARAHGERRRSAAIPSTSLSSLIFCLFLLPNSAAPTSPCLQHRAPRTCFGALRKCYQITRNTSSQLAIYNKVILLLAVHEHGMPRPESRQNSHLLAKTSQDGSRAPPRPLRAKAHPGRSIRAALPRAVEPGCWQRTN